MEKQLELFVIEAREPKEYENGERLKECFSCKGMFPETEEHFRFLHSKESSHPHPYCHTCEKEQNQIRYQLKQEHPRESRPTHCECCGVAESKIRRSLVLDHCHITGIFRGWICAKCNVGLGGLGDDLEGVQKGLDYLKRAYEKD